MAKDNGHCDVVPSGEITHYYKKPMVAVAKLNELVKVGDKVHIKGSTTDFTMTIIGLRNANEDAVTYADAGELVAFQTSAVARPGDKMWLVIREVE